MRTCTSRATRRLCCSVVRQATPLPEAALPDNTPALHPQPLPASCSAGFALQVDRWHYEIPGYTWDASKLADPKYPSGPEVRGSARPAALPSYCYCGLPACRRDGPHGPQFIEKHCSPNPSQRYAIPTCTHTDTHPAHPTRCQVEDYFRSYAKDAGLYPLTKVGWGAVG